MVSGSVKRRGWGLAALFLGLWRNNLLAEGCGRADLLSSRWQGSRKQSVRTWLRISIPFKVTLPRDLLPHYRPLLLRTQPAVSSSLESPLILVN